MFSKLRNNYRLSNVLIRIAFVLCYVLYSWQDILGNTHLVLTMYGHALNLSDSYALVTAIIASLLIGVVLVFLVPFVANVFLNFSRLYNVPRAEYGLLTHLFFTLYYFVCGVLSLINLFTPLLLTWSEKLFPFVAYSRSFQTQSPDMSC